MPVLSQPDQFNRRKIDVLMFGTAGVQRAVGVFDPNSSAAALRVAPTGDGSFWGAWTRSESQATTIHRARAICE
jgi:hypothetical protein